MAEELRGALDELPEAVIVGGPLRDQDGREVGFEAIAGTYLLPSRLWGTVIEPSLPEIDLEAEVREGRIRLTQVRIAPGPDQNVPLDLNLGRLPLRKAIRRIAALQARRVVLGGDGGEVLEVIGPDEAGAFLRALDRHERSIVRGGRADKAEFLQEVARVYRHAMSEEARRLPGGGLALAKPTKAVREHFSVTRAQASRWIREARDDGYLDEATERKAGG
jgi:hypothetical protein